MRRLSPLFPTIALVTGATTWAGCVALTPYDDGVVEGTFVLPDGTTGTFRTRAKARAFRYTGIRTSDRFQFGTNNPFGADDPAEGPVADVTITQSGLRPTPGTFDLWGHPVGTPDTVRVRVHGRFDTPWLGAAARER